jgi:hypothetical protein
VRICGYCEPEGGGLGCRQLHRFEMIKKRKSTSDDEALNLLVEDLATVRLTVDEMEKKIVDLQQRRRR